MLEYVVLGSWLIFVTVAFIWINKTTALIAGVVGGYFAAQELLGLDLPFVLQPDLVTLSIIGGILLTTSILFTWPAEIAAGIRKISGPLLLIGTALGMFVIFPRLLGLGSRFMGSSDASITNPHMIGYMLLLMWPIFCIALFKWASKPTALLVSLMGAYLLLPERLEFDLPLIPSLNKHTIPAFTAFVVLLAMDHTKDKHVLTGWIPQNILVRILLLALLVGTYFTVQTNGDTLVFGPTVLPGMSFYDAGSLLLFTFSTILPFLLARKFLAYPQHQRAILTVFTTAALIYSFLTLYEVRMSPQLNNIIYGFYQHSFLQHIRGDGFRPMVFLNHGLWVSMFLAMSCLAAAAMVQLTSSAQRMKFVLLTIWLFAVLVLTKSLGAFMITLCLLPVMFLGRRIQLLAASSVAAVVIIYPILRGAGFVPVDAILAWAEGINPNRAQSFGYRIGNEENLLARAQERPIFGWGLWGRSLIYSEETGRMTSVTDGYWIITLGFGGWVKYLVDFGLLCAPILIAFLKRRAYGLEPEVVFLCVILCGNLFDLIPNATLTPLTWLIVGSLWGRLELGKLEQQEQVAETSARVQRQSVRYTRFGNPQPAARKRAEPAADRVPSRG